ncbi:MAG: hypothetical protein Q4C49_11905 [Bacillota bacterium]|nr:hypothetical protein [Bacillota bacterium]
MISNSLIRCTINQIDVRIIDLSVFHFLFRVPDKLENIHSIVLDFYMGSHYETMTVDSFSYALEEEQEFYIVYRVDIEDDRYKNLVRSLMTMVNVYTHYKLANVPERFIDYPLDLDSTFPQSKSDLLKGIFKGNFWEMDLSRCKWGICLENPSLIARFLSLDWISFTFFYFSQANLQEHPISQVDISYVYIGNQFCSHLFPELDVLEKVLHKCEQYQCTPVIVFSTMKEQEIEKYCSILKKLPASSEIVVNDLGMLEMLKDSSFTIIEGVLLNKCVKDSRIKYVDTWKNNGNAHPSLFRKSFESSGYIRKVSPHCDLYLPKFQMNTAGMCTMFAMCKNGNRAYQEEVFTCPQYCRSQHFLYPTHLHMLGEYNTLFGYDEKILTDPSYFESFISQDIERMIITL